MSWQHDISSLPAPPSSEYHSPPPSLCRARPDRSCELSVRLVRASRQRRRRGRRAGERRVFSDRNQCVIFCWPCGELMPRGDDPAPLRCYQINSTGGGFLNERGGDPCPTAGPVSPDSYAVEVRSLWQPQNVRSCVNKPTPGDDCSAPGEAISHDTELKVELAEH